MIADHLSTDKSLSAFVNKTVLLHSVGKYAHKKKHVNLLFVTDVLAKQE